LLLEMLPLLYLMIENSSSIILE